MIKEIEAIRVTLYWLENKHRVSGQQGLADRLGEIAAENNYPKKNIGISQPTISKYLKGERKMSCHFRELMGTLVGRLHGTNFVFPDDCGQISDEICNKNPNIINNLNKKYERDVISNEYPNKSGAVYISEYIRGFWTLYSYSKRIDQDNRMLRKSSLAFRDVDGKSDCNVLSIGKSTIWKGFSQEVSGYTYVNLDRFNDFSEKMFFIFKSPDHWSKLLIGMCLSIEGISNNVHPIMATKCIAVRNRDFDKHEELFTRECGEEIVKEISDSCGYISEKSWIEQENNNFDDIDAILSKLSNEVRLEDLPFTLNLDPMISKKKL